MVYTCTTLDTGALQWAVESFHSYTTEYRLCSLTQSDQLRWNKMEKLLHKSQIFLSTWCTWGTSPPHSLYCPMTAFTTKEYGVAMVSLMKVHLHASCINMEVSSSSCMYRLYCSCFSVAPSAPVNPKYTIVSNDTASFYVLFEWMRPLSDGGLVVTNYTTILRSPDSLLTSVGAQTRSYIALM